VDRPAISSSSPATTKRSCLPRLLPRLNRAARIQRRCRRRRGDCVDNASPRHLGHRQRAAAIEWPPPPCGASAPFATPGAAVARGAVVAFIDADSEIHPETFNVIARLHEQARRGRGTTGATWSDGRRDALTYVMFRRWSGAPTWTSASSSAGATTSRRRRVRRDAQVRRRTSSSARAPPPRPRTGRRLVRARPPKRSPRHASSNQFGTGTTSSILWKGLWYLLNRTRARYDFADAYWYKSEKIRRSLTDRGRARLSRPLAAIRRASRTRRFIHRRQPSRVARLPAPRFAAGAGSRSSGQND